jgi:Leucine Rich repeat
MAAATTDPQDVPQWRTALEQCLKEGSDVMNLQSRSLGDAEAAEISQMLSCQENCAVRFLHLNQNAIGDAGATAISNLLFREDRDIERAVLPLETLGLWGNSIGEGGIAALAQGIRYNTTLKNLFLFGNPGIDGVHEDTKKAAVVRRGIGSMWGKKNAPITRAEEPPVPRGVQALVDAIAVNDTLSAVVVGDAHD